MDSTTAINVKITTLLQPREKSCARTSRSRFQEAVLSAVVTVELF